MKNYTQEEVERLLSIAAVAERILECSVRDRQHHWLYFVSEHLIDQLREVLSPANQPWIDYQRDDG